MTKKLEELLDIAVEKPTPVEEKVIVSDVIKKSKELVTELKEKKSLTISNELDKELDTDILGDNELNDELDKLSTKAMESYEALTEISLNVADGHISKIAEAAIGFLKVAQDSAITKHEKRIRALDLKLKKYKIDTDALKHVKKPAKDETAIPNLDGEEVEEIFIDRNELVNSFAQNKNESGK